MLPKQYTGDAQKNKVESIKLNFMIKLQSAEIENFRSIVGEPLLITFDDLVVIVGPNNCGKSNILRALQLFFRVGLRGVRIQLILIILKAVAYRQKHKPKLLSL